MARLGQSARNLRPMDDAPHGPAAKPLTQGVEFFDKGVKHIGGMEQIDRDEMFSDQDLVQSGIAVHPITEQAAGMVVAFPPRDDNARVDIAAYAGGPTRESQPGGQVQARNGFPDQWVNRPDSLTRQRFNDKWRHADPL